LSDKLADKSKLADAHKPIYRQIVFTAAWQESCWRQYIKKGTPLASATGDLGLMQVNRNTWRGVYDLKGLGGDIEYNGNAGGEILLNYLTRSAIKKGEHKQPGEISRGQRTRPTTVDPARWRAIGACGKVPNGKK
jgi:hypothetical protein